MLIYLQNAWHSRVDVGREAVAVIIAFLLSILRGGGGAGSELMKHIAAPMVGGIDHHHCCRCWCCRLPTGDAKESDRKPKGKIIRVNWIKNLSRPELFHNFS